METRSNAGPKALAALVMCAAVLACDIQETTLAEVEDIVVVEGFAMVGVSNPAIPAPSRLWVLLSRTVGLTDDLGVPDASVRVVRTDGTVFVLREVGTDLCVSDARIERPGTCYDAGAAAASLMPGDTLSLHVRLPDGREMDAEVLIPGAFALADAGSTCVLTPDTQTELRWSQSEGAAAYLNETRIDGLDGALEPEGIDAPSQLFLIGLSVSAADTTIVFPAEFGVFDRFDLDRDLSVRLQRGLPPFTRALVGISAVDANWVNWVRGGNFNPSGQVRVPSVRGDGTGVFGASVTRRLEVLSAPDLTDLDLPPCPGPPAR